KKGPANAVFYMVLLAGIISKSWYGVKLSQLLKSRNSKSSFLWCMKCTLVGLDSICDQRTRRQRWREDTIGNRQCILFGHVIRDVCHIWDNGSVRNAHLKQCYGCCHRLICSI